MKENISYAVFWSPKGSEHEYATPWFPLHEQAVAEYEKIRKYPACNTIRLVRRYEMIEVVQIG